jgi:pyochelin synthetase
VHIRRSPIALTLLAVVAVILLAGTALAIQSGIPASSRTGLAANGASESPDGSEGLEATDAPEASEAPEAPDASEAPEGSEGPPSAADIASIVDRLKAAGITASASELTDLATKVGVGGAVRVFAFAHASGKTPAEIVAMFESGKGWGQIKKELNLSIGPGIGWIMGHGGGGGPDASDAPGG